MLILLILLILNQGVFYISLFYILPYSIFNKTVALCQFSTFQFETRPIQLVQFRLKV